MESSLDVPVRSSPLDPVAQVREVFDALPEFVRLPIELVAFGGELPRADIPRMRWLAQCLRAEAEALNDPSEELKEILAQQDSLGIFAERAAEALRMSQESATKLREQARILADQTAAAANDAERWLCVMFAFGIYLGWQIFRIVATAMAAGPAGQVAAAPAVEATLVKGRAEVEVMRAGLRQAIVQGGANAAGRMSALGALRIPTMLARGAALPVAIDAGVQGLQILNGDRAMAIIGEEGTKNPTGIDLTSLGVAALAGAGGTAGAMAVARYTSGFASAGLGGRLMLGLTHGVAGGVAGLGAASLVVGWPPDYMHAVGPLMNGGFTGAVHGFGAARMAAGARTDGGAAFTRPDLPFRPPVEVSAQAKQAWETARAAWSADPAATPGESAAKPTAGAPTAKPTAEARGNTAAAGETPRPANPGAVQTPETPGNGRASAAPRSEPAPPGSAARAPEAPARPAGSPERLVVAGAETSPPPKVTAPAGGRAAGDPHGAPATAEPQRPVSEGHRAAGDPHGVPAAAEPQRPVAETHRTGADHDAPAARPRPDQNSDPAPDMPAAGRDHSPAEDGAHPRPAAEHDASAGETAARAPADDPARPAELSGRDQADDVLRDFNARSGDRVPEELRLSNLSDEALRAGLFHPSERESLIAGMEIIRRGTISDEVSGGMVLRPQQLEGVFEMGRRPVEVKPGQGKTLMFMSYSLHQAVRHGSTLLVTTADGLAHREFTGYQRVLGKFGIDVFRADQQAGFGPITEGRPAIVVGTSETVGHLVNAGHLPPRRVVLDEMDAIVDRGDRTFIRSEGPQRAASEEVAAEVLDGHDFLTDALAKGQLSHEDFGLKRIAEEVDVDLPDGTVEIGTEYWYDGQAKLTPAGLEKVEALPGGTRWLRDMGLSRLEMAAAAEFTVRDKTHYVMDEGKIVIIDQGEHGLQRNPTTSSESRWSAEPGKASLAQAIEAKELRIAEVRGRSAAEHQIMVRADTDSAKSITAPEIYGGDRYFDHVTGASGTLTDLGGVLKSVYGLETPHGIEPAKPSQLREGQLDVHENTRAKLNAIADYAHRMWDGGTGRAQEILVHRNDLVDQQVRALVRAGVPREAIEAVDAHRMAKWGAGWEAEMQKIFDSAGREGKILVINRQGQRGVDIPVSPEVEAKGGLHIWMTEAPEQSYIYDQAKNRTARNGNSGTAQALMSPQDEIIRKAMHLQGVREAVVRYEQAGAEHTTDPTPQTRERLIEAGEHLGSLVPGLQERAHHHATTDFILRHALTDQSGTLTAADLVDVMTPWHPDTADIGRPDLPEDRADRLADMLGIPQPAMAAALADPALTGRDGADPLRQLLEQAGLPPAAVDALRHQVDATAPATAVRHALFTDEQALNELTPQLAAFAGRLGWELADITGAEGLRRIGGELTGARYDLAAALGVPVADITPAMARDILGEQVMRQLSDTGDQVSASKADTDTRVDASIQTDTDTAGTPVAGTQPGDILVTEDVIASTSHYLALAALLDLAVAIHRRTPNNCVNNGVTAMRILCPDNAQRFTMPSGGVPLAGHGWDTVTRAFRDGSPVRSATLEQAVESVKQRPGGIQVLVYKWKDTEEQGSSDADNHLVVLVNDSAPGDPPNLVVVDLAANRDGDPAADFGPMDLTNRRTLLNKAVAFDTWQREQRKFIDRLPAGMRAFWTMDFDHAGNAVPGTTHPGAPATETLPRRVDVDPELVRDVEEALVAPQKAGSQVPDRPPENTIDLSPPGAARPVGPIGSKPGEFHLPGVMPADADEVTSSTVDRNDLLVDDGLLIHRLPSSELFPAPDVVNIELVDRNDMLIDDDLIVYRVTYARDEDAIIEWVKAEIGWRMGAPIHRSSLEPAGIAPERRHNAVYREQHDKYDNSRYHSLGAPADDILAVFGAVTGHREGLASAFVHETNEGAIWVDHHLSEEYINALAEKVEKVAETIESCRDLLTPESFALARDFHAQALSAFGEIARRAGNPERVRAIADEVEAKKEVIRKFREKHGIEEVVGFDSPYVPLENVEEIFETLDMLLVKYKIAPDSGKPMTDITSIRTDLRPHSSKMGTGSRDIDGKSFMLYDLHFASNVVSSLYGDRLDAVVGFHPVSGLRPHADTIIHEFAHAIDFATDSELSDNLPEVLRNVHADLRDRGLVDSYEQWLRRMPVYAFTDKKKTELNPGEALAVGFAVVEIVENTGGSVAVDDPAWAIHQYVTKLRAPVLDPGLRVDQRLSEGEPSKVEPMDSPAGVQIELLTYEDGRQVLRETYDFIQDAVVEWVKADIGRRMGAPIAEAVLVANATDSNADYRVIHREYEPISSRYRNFGAGADDILAVFGAVTGDRVGLSTAFVHENIRGETVWVDHHLGKEYISELGKRVEDIEKIFDDFRSAIPPEILADSPGFLAVVSDAHEQVMTAFGELARHAGKQDPVEVVEAQNAAKASVIGAFTDKYSIEVAGFDSPYIPLETVEEIFETFDMLLEKYRTSPVGSLAPVGISGIRSDLLRPTGRAVTFPVVDAKGGPASEIIFNLHFTSDLISSLRGDKLVAEVDTSRSTGCGRTRMSLFTSSSMRQTTPPVGNSAKLCRQYCTGHTRCCGTTV